MARILVFLWLSPIVLFSAWISLSSLDWHLGLPFMTREVHDRIFEIYRIVLGYERDALMAIIRNALILDAGLLAAIVAWQRRVQLRALFSRVAGAPAGPGTPAG